METKSRIIKTARVCYIVTKVLYCLACVACLTFIALAIALSVTNAIKSLMPAETAVMFSTLALYSFFAIGLLWNVESMFKSITVEQAPFGEKVSHYLKKIAIFVLMISIVPALIGQIVLRAACPSTEMTFPIEVGGIVSGVVLFLIGLFFDYGKELQKRDDETL